MDIRKRLNLVSERLSDDQEPEIDVVNTLTFLMFGRESDELPKNFTVQCFMDTETLESFLRDDLKLDVKDVSLRFGSIMFGKPIYDVELN